MGIPPPIAETREHILQIAARHGARNVRLFGSFVRGEGGPDSDVDFLIDAGPQTSSWFPGGLVADLEELLGRRVDVVEAPALHRLMRDRILAEAVPL